MASKIEITRLHGGGHSWRYLLVDGKVRGAAHEDDSVKLAELHRLKQELEAESLQLEVSSDA